METNCYSIKCTESRPMGCLRGAGTAPDDWQSDRCFNVVDTNTSSSPDSEVLPVALVKPQLERSQRAVVEK